MADITQLLHAIDRGEAKAAEELLPLVYEELRKLASAKMALEKPGHTLQPTALVHEAWLRMGGDGQGPWQNRAHFFGAATEAMRRILVERARRRQAAKRGGGEVPVDLDSVGIPSPAIDDDSLLRVNEALEKLAVFDSPKAELVKLRYFVGMNFQETAAALGIAVPTAKQWWSCGDQGARNRKYCCWPFTSTVACKVPSTNRSSVAISVHGPSDVGALSST